MSMTDKLWDALTTVIKMNDKVVTLAGVVKDQQARIESLSERVTRLEARLDTMVDMAQLAASRQQQPTSKRLK